MATVLRRSTWGLATASFALLVQDRFHGLALGHDWTAILTVVWIAALVTWLVLSAYAHPRTAAWLPSFHAEGGDGRTVQVRPPRRTGKGRLRGDTLSLVADIRAYAKQQPDASVTTMAAHSEAMRKMREAGPLSGDLNAEQHAAWEQYTLDQVQHRASETRDLAEQFGGRLQAVLTSYRERHMLTEQEASKIDWEAQSPYWIASAANKLEGLASPRARVRARAG